MSGEGETFQACVGFFKLPSSPGRPLVYLVVHGSDHPTVVFRVDEIRDAAYVLTGSMIIKVDIIWEPRYIHGLLKGAKSQSHFREREVGMIPVTR